VISWYTWSIKERTHRFSREVIACSREVISWYMDDKGENMQMLQGSDLMVHMIVKGEIHALSIHVRSDVSIR
jgi:hypothetical protein